MDIKFVSFVGMNYYRMSLHLNFYNDNIHYRRIMDVYLFNLFYKILLSMFFSKKFALNILPYTIELCIFRLYVMVLMSNLL
jgi:hypothetical protein